jgi:hypothetical protein
LEPTIRIELMTCCLQNSCSTTELRRPTFSLNPNQYNKKRS